MSSIPSSSGTELEKVKKYIDILDGTEKEVIVVRFGLDCTCRSITPVKSILFTSQLSEHVVAIYTLF
ncbi:hypothetical protein S101395_01762 [Bacillus sonorensis]|uniref:Sporulation sigma factor SigK n=2 Tax=Bacillus sonorensis TaxID=119858 RepID=M5PDS4_9BACI|nr:hypothetical protein S101395_01762 [Bacillus sonorensis]EME74965.1 sporulation sigma factor SigK [Bacillus sonorensis L12]TWK76234.1 RNA polymerase sigma-K factor [Bacillus paralicheniformis]GIN66480.1 hypothetical protein J41TS2_19010 [Bacillus sonorensis]